MKITLITKPESEGVCPYCVLAKDALTKEGIKFDVIELPYIARLDFYRGNPFNTVPQAYIEGERIGGYDNLLTFLEWLDGQAV